MAKDPAVLLYTSDFLSGVVDLTMEERGQYITLLCIQHQKGRLTQKIIDISIPNITEDVMSKFLIDDHGLFYNKRLELEAIKRREHSEKQRQRALDGWKKRKGNGKATANATALPLEDENENEDISLIKGYDFESFWNDYDKKVDRPKCEPKFNKLTENVRELIKVYIPKYKKSQPSKQYRKNPVTFLNNEGWENELITELPKGEKETSTVLTHKFNLK